MGIGLWNKVKKNISSIANESSKREELSSVKAKDSAGRDGLAPLYLIPEHQLGLSDGHISSVRQTNAIMPYNNMTDLLSGSHNCPTVTEIIPHIYISVSDKE